MNASSPPTGPDAKRLAPPEVRPQSSSRRLLIWSLLARPPLSQAVAFACLRMIRRVEARQGPPVAESRGKIVRLWRYERFSAMARSQAPFSLRDGVTLGASDAVLELHIASDLLMARLRAGQSWRELMMEEFQSLAPQLQARNELAIVGTTILIRQVEEFGATTRSVPPTLHHRLDTFYRKLILLTFHPGGVKRVLSHRYGLVEAAISIPDFCARYG